MMTTMIRGDTARGMGVIIRGATASTTPSVFIYFIFICSAVTIFSFIYLIMEVTASTISNDNLLFHYLFDDGGYSEHHPICRARTFSFIYLIMGVTVNTTSSAVTTFSFIYLIMGVTTNTIPSV